MFVPIIFEKSVYSIIAILGVVRAGGAVVPLDPTLVPARIQMIVEDVNASVVVSSTQSQGKIPSQIPQSKRVIIDHLFLRQLSTSKKFSLNNPTSTPNNALYVVYTSGSTGKPKGVVVTHAAFSSSASGFSKAISLDCPSYRVLQYSSFSFDISMLEIFTTLMTGACLCIPSEEDRMNNLASCISSMNVNWAMLTPSVASLMSPEEVPGLEVLCLVGEALPQGVADTWADHVKTINAYGPAECSAITIVSAPRIRGVKSISIGRPPNCAVWIVGENGRLAPFNTIGEIVIEGPPVARGYLGDREKTDALFLDNPDFLRGVVRDPSRCYRTGDLGRMNFDGSIDYLGRKDTQVKINGQRVELGEIEHHLKQHLCSSSEETWEVLVELLKPKGRDSGILTAFVAQKSPATLVPVGLDETFLPVSSPTWNLIRQRTDSASREIATLLPAYMVPKAFIPCRRLPLSPSGKVDRKTLRSLGNKMTAQELMNPLSQYNKEPTTNTSGFELNSADLSETEDSSVGQHTILSDSHPSSEASISLSESSLILTPTETLLRQAWAKVLRVSEDSIQPEDDFFKLGGDSIGAIRVVAACRQSALQINVANIFKNSVLRNMALVCKSSVSGKSATIRAQFTPFQFLKQDEISDLRLEASFQCGVEEDEIEDLYPCTHMQEGLMAVDLTRPGSYTGRWIHSLPSDVDLERFKRTWEEIHAALPILRTRFATTSSAGSLQAVIKEHIEWLSHTDLEAYLEEDDANSMFPGDKLNRFAIVSSKNGAMTFVWTIHHMLYDGWSLSMLCNRFNDLYHGRSLKPATDFRHFITYSQQHASNKYADYWKEELRDVPQSNFPAAPEPGHQSFARAVVKDTLDVDINQSSGLTMPTIVRAAWALMVGYFSESNDVLFGATVSGRNAPLDDIETIEGPTIATVPVRMRIDRSLPLLHFVRQVQDHATAMIPFEQTGMQQIKTLNEDTKRGCELQNLLVVQAGGGWDENGPGPLVKPMYREEFTTFPVTCEAWLHPGRIEFATHVDEDVTSRVFVAKAIETVKIIITQLSRATSLPNDSSRVADLVFDELQNPSQSKVPQEQEPIKISSSIHELITKQSQYEPKREAVVSTADALSYERLESISSALAGHLIKTGVAAGEMIPLCFEKSVWTVVAMLGVLKAGAAFVPLDPSQPISRLRKVVAQVNAKRVIISSFHAKATDLGVATRIVLDKNSWSFRGSTSRLIDSDPESPAYVIFTSGSTGTPKGIVISHSAFASSAVAHGALFGMAKESRVLQFSAYSFDASLFEILTTLIHGGTVCVPTENERFEGTSEFLREQNVNFALLTPSVARIIQPTEAPSLKTVVLGGEAPDELLIKKWLDAGTKLFNAYGPSECSVIAACHPCSYELDSRTIGRPVGCSFRIVDPDNAATLVPDGEIGELLIEGPTLAKGYLNDPERTAAAFINAPLWPGETRLPGSGPLYKTGDLVKRSDRGALVYVGRKDLQVKLNGQRIELGDIESHLAVCQSIKRGVVVFPSSGPFSKQIVAVLELQQDILKSAPGSQHTISRFNEEAGKIRKELSSKIPSIMLPTHWVDITTLSRGQFPLSPSGKVDRRQIATWVEELSPAKSQFLDKTAQVAHTTTAIFPGELPAYELADKIASLVRSESRSSVYQPPGCFDDIFLHSSGLDSLNMMSLMHFIHMKHRVRVSMQLLMNEHTSIRSLAAFIEDYGLKKTPHAIQSPQSTSHEVDIMAQINHYDAELLNSSRRIPRPILRHSDEKRGKLRVFLTGASGYLGTQILRQLLERPDVDCVTTLVRGANSEAAKSRVVDAAQKALWWTEFHEEKLKVWAGDLSKPVFGLRQDQWALLEDGNSFDIIIHNGAVVHWNKSYAALQAVNIGSTIQLLDLAVRSPSLRFVYVSGGRQWRSEDESEEEVAHELSDAMGYSQTKFVAETLVKRAASRCLPTQRNLAVFRPGLIIGTPTEGVANLDDYIWRLTAASIDIGVYNGDDENAWLHISDAATTAAAVIRTAFDSRSQEQLVKQHDDGMTWGEFWRLIKATGYDISPAPGYQWLPTVKRDISTRKEAHPLWPLAHLLDDTSMEWDVRVENPQDCPIQLKVAVMRNVEFLASNGFLPTVSPEHGSTQKTPGTFSRSGFK